MHGIIFHEFRHFTNQQLGFQGWNKILKEADLEGKLYLPMQMYPDDELESLLQSASNHMTLKRDALLERFGQHIIPQFMRIFGQIVKQEWHLMDVLEHTEDVIHRTIRQYDRNATPPPLICERAGATCVHIYYASPRNMLAFGRGLVLGLSEYYKEPVRISETTAKKNGKVIKKLSVIKI